MDAVGPPTRQTGSSRESEGGALPPTLLELAPPASASSAQATAAATPTSPGSPTKRFPINASVEVPPPGQDDDDDDPDDASPPTMSLTAAAFHIFNANVGAGVFLLPTFYNSAGTVIGAALALLAGFVILDCMLMLLEVKRVVQAPGIDSYPAVVRFVLGKSASRAVQWALMLFQFGFCIMYLDYAASLIAEVIGRPALENYFVVAGVFTITPLTFLSHKLDLLARASMAAAAAVIFCVFGSLVIISNRLRTVGPAQSVEFATWPPMNWVMYLAGQVMSLEGIGALLPVENEVGDKENFPKTISRTVSGVILLFVVFGQVGYFAYGTALRASVLHAFKETEFSQMLQLSLAMSLLLSYPIQYVPGIEIIDRILRVKSRRSRKARLARIALNVTFGFVASTFTVDTLEIFAEFLGAFVGTHLSIMFPALLMLYLDVAESLGKEEENVPATPPPPAPTEGPAPPPLSTTNETSGPAVVDPPAPPPASVPLTLSECFYQVWKQPKSWLRIKCIFYIILAIVVCVVGTVITVQKVIP